LAGQRRGKGALLSKQPSVGARRRRFCPHNALGCGPCALSRGGSLGFRPQLTNAAEVSTHPPNPPHSSSCTAEAMEDGLGTRQENSSRGPGGTFGEMEAEEPKLLAVSAPGGRGQGGHTKGACVLSQPSLRALVRVCCQSRCQKQGLSEPGL
jgi:hypothetical protein